MAVLFLEKVLPIHPSDLFLHYQLGFAHFALSDYDHAAPLLSEVYRVQPNLDSLGFYIGYLRYRQKDYDGALTAFIGNQTEDFDGNNLLVFIEGWSWAFLDYRSKPFKSSKKSNFEDLLLASPSA